MPNAWQYNFIVPYQFVQCAITGLKNKYMYSAILYSQHFTFLWSTEDLQIANTLINISQ